MNPIVLDQTEFTPKVVLDHVNFKFEIAGESSPEDARQFYAPLIKWIDDFGKYLHFLYSNNAASTRKPLVFSFHFDYVTSSSLKNIYDLLVKIEKLKEYTDQLTIRWVYDAEDEDMEDNGHEFSKMLQIPFEVVSA
jgi:hypothetical protein